MFHFKIKNFALIPLVFLWCSLAADEGIEKNTEIKAVEEQKSGQSEPFIRVKYYSADAIQAIPRLKPLANLEPECNKVLFKLENFPKNEEIILEIKRLASDNPKAYERKVSFFIEDDGSILIAGSDQHLQTIICSSHGFLPGERATYRFRTADGSINKEISGIPTPAVVKNKDYEVQLKAELVSINPTVYQISLPTMEDGEEYELKATSIGQITRAKPKYVKNTPFHYSPVAEGNSKGGDANLEILRAQGQVYKIQLPWGTALEAYLSGKKIYSSK